MGRALFHAPVFRAARSNVSNEASWTIADTDNLRVTMTQRKDVSHDRSTSTKQPTVARRILGVDPGLNTTGYGVIEVDPITGRARVIEAGVVRGTRKESVTLRILEIHTGITDVIAAHAPNVMAIEELYSHYKQPKTAILMGHARGVICLAGAQAGISVCHYAATRVKSILSGSGHAPKSQVQESVKRELGLDAIPQPNDVADALSIALCHSYLSKNSSDRSPIYPSPT